MPLVEIVLFGMPQIQYDAVPIDFVRRKSLALIAYLAVTNQRHSRDSLAEFFWPDTDGVASRTALCRVLSSINETPLNHRIDADRDTSALQKDDGI